VESKVFLELALQLTIQHHPATRTDFGHATGIEQRWLATRDRLHISLASLATSTSNSHYQPGCQAISTSLLQ
jgi:hypothetical protein